MKRKENSDKKKKLDYFTDILFLLMKNNDEMKERYYSQRGMERAYLNGYYKAQKEFAKVDDSKSAKGYAGAYVFGGPLGAYDVYKTNEDILELKNQGYTDEEIAEKVGKRASKRNGRLGRIVSGAGGALLGGSLGYGLGPTDSDLGNVLLGSAIGAGAGVGLGSIKGAIVGKFAKKHAKGKLSNLEQLKLEEQLMRERGEEI